MKDLPQSLLGGGRIYDQAQRMEAVCPNPHQRLLLYTGYHRPDAKGLLSIGHYTDSKTQWETTRWYYSDFQAALSKLQDSGLPRMYGLASNQEIPWWVVNKLNHLTEFKTRPIKQIHNHKSLRKIEPAEQFDSWLARSIDGVGLVLAKRILNYCKRPIWVLPFLTDVSNAGKVPGVGVKLIARTREQLGFGADFDEYSLWPISYGITWCGKHAINWDNGRYKKCPLCSKE